MLAGASVIDILSYGMHVLLVAVLRVRVGVIQNAWNYSKQKPFEHPIN